MGDPLGMTEELVNGPPLALPEVPQWRDDAILVVPGLPESLTRPQGELLLFPGSTVEFVKLMRAIDLPIEMTVPKDEQTLVSHFAAEVWLPFLNIGVAVLSGAAGNLLATMVEGAFRRTDEKTITHIDWRVKTKDGATHRFKYDGPAKGARSAAQAFEKSLQVHDDE
jgi:hypothetical protein